MRVHQFNTPDSEHRLILKKREGCTKYNKIIITEANLGLLFSFYLSFIYIYIYIYKIIIKFSLSLFLTVRERHEKGKTPQKDYLIIIIKKSV